MSDLPTEGATNLGIRLIKRMALEPNYDPTGLEIAQEIDREAVAPAVAEAVKPLVEALESVASEQCCETPGCSEENPHCNTMLARAALAPYRREGEMNNPVMVKCASHRARERLLRAFGRIQSYWAWDHPGNYGWYMIDKADLPKARAIKGISAPRVDPATFSPTWSHS